MTTEQFKKKAEKLIDENKLTFYPLIAHNDVINLMVEFGQRVVNDYKPDDMDSNLKTLAENPTGEIKKITMEYENVKESLSGNQAKDWLDTVNEMCTFLQLTRNANPFKDKIFNWKNET
jgi:hypothetical protein